MEKISEQKSPEIHLHKATLEDLKTFVELEKGVDGPKTYSAMTDEEEAKGELANSTVYLIESGGEVVGSIMYERKSDSHVYISDLAIRPERQGSGVGRAVLEQVLKEIGDVERIDLVTHPENEKAIRLYTSLGFHIESEKEDYFGDGETRVVMSKLKK